MGTLFKDTYAVVTVNINNETYPTSHFFRGGQSTDIVVTGPEPKTVSVWCDVSVTKNIAVNSNILSGEVKLNFHPLARNGRASDETGFQRHAFTKPSEILEIVSSLIRQGLVEKNKDGETPATYVLYTKNAHVFFYDTCFGWRVYFKNKIDLIGKTQFRVSMYDIGLHCTVISPAK